MPKFPMLKWLWLAVLSLGLDQASKLIIDNVMQLYESRAVFAFFNLTYVHNTGAAFSFLSDAGGWQRWLFAGLAVGMSILISVWLTRLKPNETFFKPFSNLIKTLLKLIKTYSNIMQHY